MTTQLSDDLRGIEQRFKMEIEPYRSDLWKYCYKLTRSPWDAEDLVQDTLFKSLAMLAKMHRPVKMKSYLFKIATNMWIDRYRRNPYTFHTLEEEDQQDHTSTFDFEIMDHLEFLMQHLTPHQYVSLLLAEVFRFKASEIAGMISTTEGAVYTNLTRARSVLRKAKGGQMKSIPVLDLVPDATLNTLLNGFRNKEPELIASVLSENVTVNIVHAGIEMGRDETKGNSLNDWKEVVDTQHQIVVEYKMLWGKRVVVEMERKLDGDLYLNNLHLVEVVGEEITHWAFYCFSWDLMKQAAEELQVKLNATCFYHIF
ncbi:RNA polymerase sigma factor [Bacillus sp. es.034]|uniref:RNA polymerase sigma factor n=1 Tax=Bacillus sp. es.034 TaxID=1761763 RepID=UPI000BF75DA6|nr:RNA polymerase sigma factor [Bacillus sp. es.034]PFG03501.1 RNA polymerase sigma-70 factor (ECF subfamily) [Bacillus sp. es.034]